MKIGFTGTAKGMTGRQRLALAHELQAFDVAEAHHGDCVGADTEFHDLIRTLFPKATIVSHPGFPESDSRRANNPCDEVRPVPDGGPLKRNRNIVVEADFMFATPLLNKEILRSGTWSTIRYAAKLEVNRPLVIISPDGTIENRSEKAGRQME